MKNLIITVITLCVFIIGCATGEKVRRSIHEGMTKEELKSQLGAYSA